MEHAFKIAWHSSAPLRSRLHLLDPYGGPACHMVGQTLTTAEIEQVTCRKCRYLHKVRALPRPEWLVARRHYAAQDGGSLCRNPRARLFAAELRDVSCCTCRKGMLP